MNTGKTDTIIRGRRLLAAMLLFSASATVGQTHFSERLPDSQFDADPPSSRVTGAPGKMVYIDQSCRSEPLETIRSRIVNTAVQEWAFFGYSVLDLVPTRESNPDYRRQPWRRTLIDADEALRVADSIAGYWSSTPNSTWILENQNKSWESRGVGSRWRNPWSAAFISWVMCESGISDPRVFRRAIAHYSYIDQAIEATDDNESLAAYIALDPGQQQILPGDMLCRGSRPAYRTIDARRKQSGVGARTHCDIVVKLDGENERIMLIGGNVRSWVRLKLLPAAINDRGLLAPIPYNGRRIFAHLKLQTGAASNDLLENSPTLQALPCRESQMKLGQISGSLAGSCFLQAD